MRSKANEKETLIKDTKESGSYPTDERTGNGNRAASQHEMTRNGTTTKSENWNAREETFTSNAIHRIHTEKIDPWVH
jgi:hypothetical protein